MSFKDIKGQDRAVSFLKGAIESGRLAHAYLFLGPDGVGKKLTAMNFAKALNCLGSGDDKPCDACVSCKKADSSNHPDISVLQPEKPGSSLKIDDIRAVIRSVNLKPYEARTKVYIIDDAGAMGREAQNAFLKTLEEPPADSVIILISRDAQGLFQTIVSRLQAVKFFALRPDIVKDILVKSHGLEEADAASLSRLACGSISAALRYKDEGFADKRSRILKGLADRTLFDSDFDKTSKTDLKLYLNIMLTWYRDIMVMKAGSADGLALLNSDKRETILRESKAADLNRLDGIIKQIISTEAYLDDNVNAKLAMSALGVSICMK